MESSGKFYPKEVNLGKDCQYWNLGGSFCCCYPNANLEGRRSCEGIIDDVCLWILGGRKPSSLSEEQIIYIQTHRPDPRNLPPGNIK